MQRNRQLNHAEVSTEMATTLARREQMTTIRAKNGLAAFPAREESVFDTFGVGHS
jgi:deoxyxylulose-5-phosphate synthase